MNDSTFVELCARVLDGTASAGDLRQWNERIATDSRQRGLYRDWCGQQVWIEEEWAGIRHARSIQPPRPVAPFARWATVAALIVTAGAWWWNRSESIDHGQSGQFEATASAQESVTAAPSAFTYPFDGFPSLQPESIESDQEPALRVVALDGVDPRIVMIAQRLAGFEFSGPPSL